MDEALQQARADERSSAVAGMGAELVRQKARAEDRARRE